MNRLLSRLTLTITVGILLYSTPITSQLTPSAKKAARVQITQGPDIERADHDSAIITWRSNNPGGSPEHFGVVYYGTSPKELSQTAKSHIRLNPTHSYTVFRVYMPDLKPKTTYYYKVDSVEPDGASDGVVSPVKHFTTP